MARVTKANLLQPFWTATLLAEQPSGDVPTGLLSTILRDLNEAGVDLPEAASAAIEAIADEFAFAGSTRKLWGEPGRQKQVIKALTDGAGVAQVFEALAPEYLIELCTYLNPGDVEWVLDPVGEPADVIARVRFAAAKLVHNYNPRRGRRTDVVLETAVRALIEVLEPVLGGKLRVSNNKSKGGTGPSPNCAGTRAIIQLLNGIDPRHATPTAILNTLDRVKRQPEASAGHLIELFYVNPITALDASLLPGRHEEIRRIRDDPNYGFA